MIELRRKAKRRESFARRLAAIRPEDLRAGLGVFRNPNGYVEVFMPEHNASERQGGIGARYILGGSAADMKLLAERILESVRIGE